MDIDIAYSHTLRKKTLHRYICKNKYLELELFRKTYICGNTY